MILRDSRGVAAVMVAMMIVVLIGFVGFAADIGYYYYTKFKLQSTADAVVLAVVKDTESSPAIADDIIQKNNLDPAELEKKEIELGEWDAETKTFTPTNDPAPDKIAMRVLLQRQIPAFFSRVVGIESYHPLGRATAALVQEGAVVSLGATLLEVNTQKATLLNGLLGSLLGTTIQLDAVGWKGLADTNIDLVRFLELAKVRLGIGTVDGLLQDGAVSLLDIVDLSLDALVAEDTTARASLELLRTQILGADIDPLNLKVKLGEIIQLDTNQGALAKADANLLDFIRVAAEVFNFKSGITAGANVGLPGLLSVDLKAKVVEPPVMKIMAKGDTIHSAAVRLYLNAQVGAVVNNLLGIPKAGVLNLPLYLELGAGDAELQEITTDSVVLNATSTTSNIFLGSINEGLFFTDESLTLNDFGRAQILNILNLVTADAKTRVDEPGGSAVLTFPPPFPQTQSVNATLGNSVAGITGDLDDKDSLDLEVQLLGLNLDLGGVTGQIVAQLNSLILNPLIEPLLNSVSTMLGVYPGRTDVTVHGYAYSVRLVD